MGKKNKRGKNVRTFDRCFDKSFTADNSCFYFFIFLGEGDKMKKTAGDYLDTLARKCVQCEDRMEGSCLPLKKKYRIFLEVEQEEGKKSILSCGWWSGEGFYLSEEEESHIFKNRELAENTALRLEETVHPALLVKNAQVHEFYEKGGNCKK